MLFCQTSGFQYSCVVNGVSLSARYENKSSILCLVDPGDVSIDKTDIYS